MLLSSDDFAALDIEHLTPKVHGLNCYSHLNKAAVLFAANPKPDEQHLIRIAARAIDGMNPDDAIHSILIERYLESCYQFLARIGFRLSIEESGDQVYTVVVPDIRAANYLASWFEDGCATIDVSHSYGTKELERSELRAKVRSEKQAKVKAEKAVTKLNKAKERKSAVDDKQRAIVKAILLDKKNKVGRMKDLLIKHGIAAPTFAKYKAKFKPELKELGLL